jgi:hypothetical protein
VMSKRRHRVVATRRQTEAALSLDLPRHISTLRVPGPRFASFLTPSCPADQLETALNQHFYALSERH